MIRECNGNLIRDDADALVNTVNTVGIMGKGIALQFKRAYPDMFADYAKAAKAGDIAIGSMHVWPTGALTGPQYVINFPTKRHWRSPSRLSDVRVGLDDLVRVVKELGIRSIAVPPLGCGNGGLDWAVVRPVIEEAFAALPGVELHLYPPDGAPRPSEMVDRRAVPKLTPMRAALLYLIGVYHDATLEWPGQIETQKLAYFMQEAGESMRLKFSKGPYGPYADSLRKTLREMEGHYITGFGDGSQRPLESSPIEVSANWQPKLQGVIAKSPSTEDSTKRVIDLICGFPGTYDLELLATVHWSSKYEGVSNPVEASRIIQSWTGRKAFLFTSDRVDTAWRSLADAGWLPAGKQPPAPVEYTNP